MEMELRLRIVLEKPPSGVDFGLQKGRGVDYQTIQKQRSASKDLSFVFSVRVKDDGKNGIPTLLGPLVQGPPAQRFVYIDIGTYAGQVGTPWSRRLKVPLTGITWEMIDKLKAQSESILETRVPGTGKDGGPACATVKPFNGWKVSRGFSR